MSRIINIAGYKFVHLAQLDTLQTTLDRLTTGLRGTILLSEEGINFMLAGCGTDMQAILDFLAQDPRFHDIDIKRSFSADIPFKRKRIKIKPTIIPLDDARIDPAKQTGEYLSPETLKAWYDSGKEFVILDTRNGFEVDYGTFDNAIDLRIDNFRHFPEFIKQLDPALKDKPVVTFCTGGIRCEKATAHMIEEGYKQVYQLEGGILKYFEQCQGAHYHGDCFVFDEREVVEAPL